MSYTPGPWKARGRRIEQAEDGGLLATITDRPFVNSGMFTVEQMRDNARLIATSPDMAACLEMFVMEHKAGMTPTKATIAEARAILKRIKGES